MPRIFSEEEREIIRGKLLRAGREELERKGFRQISVDKIAVEAGIAKGTFYHFFPSKEAFFCEIMELIKEQNRQGLKELTGKGRPSRAEIRERLFARYTQLRTVYEYFSPEDIKIIMRKLPEKEKTEDSVEFAQWICGRLGVSGGEEKAKVIVNMCNIMGMAAADRGMLDAGAYEETVWVFCSAMADYICSEEEKNR